jgi:hypothetical protein
MSSFTSIMLYVSPLEEEHERIEEVNSIEVSGSKVFFIDVNNSQKFPDAFPRFIYVATFNHFHLEEFIELLQTKVNWKYPEYVQLIVQDEMDYTLKFYSNAGRTLLVDSVKQ